MGDFRYGDKVRIAEHENDAHVGKIGTLLVVMPIRPARNGQVIEEKVYKVRLDDTGDIVECLLSQLGKTRQSS